MKGGDNLGSGGFELRDVQLVLSLTVFNRVLIMKFAKNSKTMLTAFAVVLLSACTVVPDPIDVADNTNLVSFEEASASIVSVGPIASGQPLVLASGQKARWGGKIVSVVNKQDVSEIEVVFFPENSFGKPITSMPSAGRFKAVVDGFVDPLVFEPGRLITVVGELTDSQVGVIGEQEYTYPTINAKGYYMWKETTDVNVEIDTFAFSPFGYRAGFHRNFFNPWYDPWLRNHQRGRIRVDKYDGHSQGGTVKPSKAPQTTKSEAPRPVEKIDHIQSAKPLSQR